VVGGLLGVGIEVAVDVGVVLSPFWGLVVGLRGDGLRPVTLGCISALVRERARGRRDLLDA